MTATTAAPAAMWDEITRATNSIREHIEQNNLWTSSVTVFTTRSSSSRVEIRVSGELSESCARLLDWRDTLTNTWLYMRVGREPGESDVSVFGRFAGTAVTVTAPLGEEDVSGLSGNQLGEWVLDWLHTHAG